MLPKWSVKKPFTVGVIVVIVFVLGFVSFSRMTTDLLPSVDLPFMIVTTTYPGASPEKIEESVTKPLEKALATTSGLANIQSISNENASMVMLEFNQDTNMDSAMLEVDGKIDQVEGMFEEGISSPIIMKMNPNMMPIMMLSIDVEGMDQQQVSNYVKKQVIPSFERIEGVASVSPMGLVEEKIVVKLDEEKISELNKKVLQRIDQELSKQEDTLTKAQQEVSGMKDALGAEKDTQLKKLEATIVQLQTAKEQLEKVVGNIGFSEEELSQKLKDINEMYAKNQAQLTVLQEAINQVTPENPEYSELYTEIALLEEANRALKEGIAQMEQGLKAMAQLRELEKQEKGLMEGKATLEREFANATNQIGSSEVQLENAKGQLEAAKKVAYEKAGIEEQLTPEMIGTLLKAQNFAMPAGYLQQNEEQYVIKVGDTFQSIQEIEDLMLFSTEEMGEIKVKDIANVSINNNADELYTNINGNPGVILTFQKASGYSTASVSKGIRQQINNLGIENPSMQLTTLSDQGIYIDLIIDSVLDNLIYGGLLAIIVLLVFLRSFKTTLVVAFSIPISVLFAIVLMYFSGVTLNIISLSGLALGVGMLVDNSIVVIENIYRLRQEGVTTKEAAILGAQQVGGAIFASTLTTICVFLPIVFTSGMTKQLFVDMGLTIAYSLVASLIVALTLVPAMSASLLEKVEEKEQKGFKRFVSFYERLLVQGLKHKAIVLSVVIGLFIFCIYEVTQIGTTFMPEMDSMQMTATLSVEKGEGDIYEMSDAFINRLLSIEAIETVGALESSAVGGMTSTKINEMMFYIILKEERDLSNLQVEELIYEKTEDLDGKIEVAASNMDMSALSGSGIEVIIKGREMDVLTNLASQIGGVIQTIEGATDVTTGLENTSEEIRIVVDKNKAMGYGLTVAQVYQMISAALKDETNTTSLTIESADYPVVVSKANPTIKDQLEDYMLNVTQGNEKISIRLGDIAQIEIAQSLNAINHDNQIRYITVSAVVDKNHNIGLVSRALESELKDFQVPDGYTVEVAGENQMIKDAMKDFTAMITLAILFVYLIMVAQFQSLRSPFIVMFTIPLAFTGGLLALLLTGNELSVISMLGFLVLAGIIVNNGIVFVDYVNQLRLEGRDKREALVEAGKTRIRPILMTALTTILAMSTMAIGVGMGSEMTQGLAIVTIGGLLYGTLLTLIVIPIMYDLFNHTKKIN